MKRLLLLTLLVAVGLSAGCKNKVQGPETIEVGLPPTDTGTMAGEDLSMVPPPPPPPGSDDGTGVEPWPEPPVTPVPPAPAGRVHVVKPKETLWQLCRIYYGTANKALEQKIVQANPAITDPNKIFIGQKIVIPE